MHSSPQTPFSPEGKKGELNISAEYFPLVALAERGSPERSEGRG